MGESYQLNVGLQPDEVLTLIKEGMTQQSELLYEELNDLGDNRRIGTLVYERFFFRSRNQAALVIIADNLQGITNVRIIPAGAAQGLVLKIDWGTGRDFAALVEHILADFVLR